MLETKLEQDIKSALLAGDRLAATTLRGLKASLLNVKVAQNKRESGLTDDEVIEVFSKESKKRQESADLYSQAGDKQRTDKELEEKAIIDGYLPEQLDEESLGKLVDEAILETGVKDIKSMGQVIGFVKTKAGPGADGSLIAKLTREKLQ
jgi:uncharacterized protein YqeY